MSAHNEGDSDSRLSAQIRKAFTSPLYKSSHSSWRYYKHAAMCQSSWIWDFCWSQHSSVSLFHTASSICHTVKTSCSLKQGLFPNHISSLSKRKEKTNEEKKCKWVCDYVPEFLQFNKKKTIITWLTCRAVVLLRVVKFEKLKCEL